MMLPAVRSLALLIRMTVRNVLRGVYVNTEGVERVRGMVFFIYNVIKVPYSWKFSLDKTSPNQANLAYLAHLIFDHVVKIAIGSM